MDPINQHMVLGITLVFTVLFTLLGLIPFLHHLVHGPKVHRLKVLTPAHLKPKDMRRQILPNPFPLSMSLTPSNLDPNSAQNESKTSLMTERNRSAKNPLGNHGSNQKERR